MIVLVYLIVIAKGTSCFHYFCMVHPYIPIHSIFTLVLHAVTRMRTLTPRLSESKMA